jgi:hypothetical protein
MELLRPVINAQVSAFVAEHARSDFPQSGYNVHRVSGDVTQLLLHKASLPPRDRGDGGVDGQNNCQAY